MILPKWSNWRQRAIQKYKSGFYLNLQIILFQNSKTCLQLSLSNLSIFCSNSYHVLFFWNARFSYVRLFWNAQFSIHSVRLFWNARFSIHSSSENGHFKIIEHMKIGHFKKRARDENSNKKRERNWKCSNFGHFKKIGTFHHV